MGKAILEEHFLCQSEACQNYGDNPNYHFEEQEELNNGKKDQGEDRDKEYYFYEGSPGVCGACTNKNFSIANKLVEKPKWESNSKTWSKRDSEYLLPTNSDKFNATKKDLEKKKIVDAAVKMLDDKAADQKLKDEAEEAELIKAGKKVDKIERDWMNEAKKADLLDVEKRCLVAGRIAAADKLKKDLEKRFKDAATKAKNKASSKKD